MAELPHSVSFTAQRRRRAQAVMRLALAFLMVVLVLGSRQSSVALAAPGQDAPASAARAGGCAHLANGTGGATCTTPPYIGLWGSFGTDDSNFMSPSGVALDGSGYAYVADLSNNRIQKFSATSPHTHVTTWGGSGDGDGKFNKPFALAVDGSGYVYVSEEGNNRIQKFDSGGTFVTKWGSEGSNDGQFLQPHGIAVDRQGYVYVADSDNNRIQKFRSDGTFVAKWGKEGSGAGQMYMPWGIGVDSTGHVYVTDKGNDRIEKFDSYGNYLAAWGHEGSGDREFNDPQGLASDATGNVYVADTFNNRVQKLKSDGTFATKWGTLGYTGGYFNQPVGIAVDNTGHVYVADTGNNWIQEFGCDTTGFYGLEVRSSGAGSGSVSTDPVGPLYANNTIVTLQASPDSNSLFEGWSGDASGSNTTTTVTMSDAKVVTATFTLGPANIQLHTAGTGSGHVDKSTPDNPIDGGKTITLTAVADTDSRFAGWSGDAEGTTSPLPLLMTSNREVTATFNLKTYTFSTATAGNGVGTVAVSPAGTTFTAHTPITLTATATSGTHSRFVGWSGGVISTTNPVRMSVEADTVVTATFALITHTLTFGTLGTGNGSVETHPAGPAFVEGSVVTMTARPDLDSTFIRWTGDVQSMLNPITTTVGSDKAITATFIISSEVPIANAGPDRTVGSATRVTLDGSGSTDPASRPLTYAWSQIAGQSVTLSNPAISQPAFTAPTFRTGSKTLKFQLVVTNTLGWATADAVTVVVRPDIAYLPLCHH